jgi:hypothetical protein
MNFKLLLSSRHLFPIHNESITSLDWADNEFGFSQKHTVYCLIMMVVYTVRWNHCRISEKSSVMSLTGGNM